MFKRRKNNRLNIKKWQRPNKKYFIKARGFTNPLFPKREKAFKITKFSRRTKFIISAVILIIIIIVWFLFFSVNFTIKNIAVIGAQRLTEKEIKDMVYEQIKSGLGLQKNIFLFDKSELADNLNNKYFLDNLNIKKNLPANLTISFNEREYSIIWLEDEKYYYLDELANVITEADPLQISQKNYPLIDNISKIKIAEKKINISADKIKFIISLYNELKNRQFNFKIDRFIIDDNQFSINLAILAGPTIYFNIREDLFKQLDKLTVIINEKLKSDFNKKTYIDLRYGDRVYYR